MNDPVSSVIILSMSIAIAGFASAFLVSQNKTRKDHRYFLAAFLCLYGLNKTDQLYLTIEGYKALPHLAGVMFVFSLFLPALVYFYARSITSPTQSWFNKYDWLAIIAPLIAISVALPYYGLSADQKIALMSPDTRDPILYQRALLGCQIGFALFIATSLFYLSLTITLFRKHSERVRHLFSRIDDKDLNWLRWVIVILAVGWSMYGVSELWAIQGSRPNSVLIVTQLFELSWVTFFALLGLRQAPIYQLVDQDSEVVVTGSPSHYARSSLSYEKKSEIARQLESAMMHQGLFEDPDLSLRKLSDCINVSENDISETFSQHLDTNFYYYINHHRVGKACLLLKNTQKAVLDIAYEVGFNSRSTFNSSFKKQTGHTPSQFRNMNSISERRALSETLR